jgi:glycosyltransferase involved in cell wall biosynthesis
MADISVILCTYNRCENLAKALDSLAGTVMPPAMTWEIFVIDNNSSDCTAEVVEQFQSRYPGRFHYIFEPSQGKSFALNTGIKAAKGNVLAFIDDDVVASSSWLQNLTADILAGTCSGAGGKILLDPNFVPPTWLPVEGPFSVAGMLAVFDLGNQPRALDRPPFGTNMAFLRAMFDKYGLFRTDMGPAPGSEIRNEDVEFCRRLMNGGEILRYEPDAIVYHAVPERRRTQEYFLQFWFDHGRAVIREGGVRPAVLGVPRRYLSIVKAAFWSVPLSAVRWLLASDARTRFYRKGWLWMLAGQISEWSHASSSKDAKSPELSGTASGENLPRNA